MISEEVPVFNFNSVLIFSENPTQLAEFYQNVLGKEPDMADQEYYGFAAGSGFLTIGPHDNVRGKNSNPERLMVNFETPEVQEEFDRIKALGATVIAEPYQVEGGWIATLADPDGNYFQLMTPWEGEP